MRAIASAPAEQDAPPGWISLISSRGLPPGDHRKAAEIVTDDLTLPASLGRICPRLCEERCRQCEVKEALSIRNLHRFAADRQLTQRGLVGQASRLPPGRLALEPANAGETPAQPAGGTPAPLPKRVAIVGAGPAGLAAAHHLLRQGHGAVLFDAHPQPGGMLRYGIPAFRLPRQVLDAEIQMIRNLGAEFRLGKRLGRDFTLEELRRDFDAVFLAIGAQGSRGLGCPGEELATPALEFLEKLADGPPPAVGE